MTKDEMKYKISMSLKDPVLQQGFEIICKNLAELEKESYDNSEPENQMPPSDEFVEDFPF